MNPQLKSALPALSILGIIVIGAIAFKLSNPVNPSAVQPHAPTEAADEKGRTIMLHTVNWEFQPSTITVKQGENVSLHLMGIQGDHGIAIPELGIRETLSEGETKLVKIPTDKPGRYSFACNVPCGRGHRDMTGTIIIE